jgi:asparagine synthase (glutamine-hydrolysing)
VLENLGHDPAAAYYADLCFQKPADARRLLGLAPDRDPRKSPVYEAVTEPYRRCPSRDPLQKAEYADLKVYLPNDPLVKVDRMSMAHALEVRCPLLDRKVVELAFRIPAARKQQRRQGKVLLRALARRRLPGGLWSLPKRGFTAPVNTWITGPHGTRFRDEVLSPSAPIAPLLDQREVSRQHGLASEAPQYGWTLWTVWVLTRWMADVGTGTRLPVLDGRA